MPPRSSPSITSTTKRAKCLSGSHSSTDGGRRNAVRRSKSRKLLIAIKPPFGANQWRDSSENQRRWVKSDRLLGKLFKKRLRILQIGSFEAFREPAVDWREQVVGLPPLAPIGPELGEIAGGSKLEEPRRPLTGIRQRGVESGFGAPNVVGVASQTGARVQPVQFRRAKVLASRL